MFIRNLIALSSLLALINHTTASTSHHDFSYLEETLLETQKSTEHEKVLNIVKQANKTILKHAEKNSLNNKFSNLLDGKTTIANQSWKELKAIEHKLENIVLAKNHLPTTVQHLQSHIKNQVTLARYIDNHHFFLFSQDTTKHPLSQKNLNKKKRGLILKDKFEIINLIKNSINNNFLITVYLIIHIFVLGLLQFLLPHLMILRKTLDLLIFYDPLMLDELLLPTFLH